MVKTENNYFENDFAEVSYKDKTIFVTYKDNAKVSLQGAEKMTELLKSLVNGEPSLMVADIRKLHFIAKDARKFLSTTEATSHIKAMAIYSDNYVNNALGNLYLLINKPKIPSKLFSSMDKAMEWIKDYK